MVAINKRGTVRFSLRIDKLRRDGKAPLRMIYSIFGRRAYLSPGIFIYPEQWDRESQTIDRIPASVAKNIYHLKKRENPTRERIEAQNLFLFNLKRLARDAETYFKAITQPFNSNDIVDRIKEMLLTAPERAAKVAKAESVVNFIFEFCDLNPGLEDVALRKNPRTLQLYKNIARDLQAFEDAGNPKATFSSMDREYLTKFFQHLVTVNENTNTTCSKKISTLQTLLNFAQDDRYGFSKKVTADYRGFKIKRMDGKFEVVALTEKEFKALRNVKLSFPLFEIARDIFIFTCYTGLRISDLIELKKIHIKNGSIEKIVHKTGERIKVPLSKGAKGILSKYENNPEKLISINSAQLNEAIKEVCKIAGIDTPIEKVRKRGSQTIKTVQPKYERVSIHTARKTFTTLLLSRGINPTDVMALTGHKKWASFKRYIDVSNHQKALAIEKGFEDL